jgi:hypothetical protein
MWNEADIFAQTFQTMPAAQLSPPLSNLQLELLKLYAYNLQEEDMLELKKVLAAFFAERIRKRTKKIWQERGYTQETMQQWLNDENQ